VHPLKLSFPLFLGDFCGALSRVTAHPSDHLSGRFHPVSTTGLKRLGNDNELLSMFTRYLLDTAIYWGCNVSLRVTLQLQKPVTSRDCTFRAIGIPVASPRDPCSCQHTEVESIEVGIQGYACLKAPCGTEPELMRACLECIKSKSN